MARTSTLEAAFSDRSASLAVVGGGQVGLPVAVAFAAAGFQVVIVERDPRRAALLQEGTSYLPDVPSEVVLRLRRLKRLSVASDPGQLRCAAAIIVCVPTPLSKTREPDMRNVLEACHAIAEHASNPALVVIESTTYPGATEELLTPILAGHDRKVGRDLFIAFSPERIDPGNRTHGFVNTPKVISGVTKACLSVATTLYRQVVSTLVPVSSTQTAETAKLLENTFRAVNIALANEMALVARKLGVDPFEVIDAAASKPFGFLPFYPGPGLGGHCIPVDPLYLSWKMRTLNYEPRLIAVADAINSAMPQYVVTRLEELLLETGRHIADAHILIYGVAYKRDVSDTRESPGVAILHQLTMKGARVDYLDPNVPLLGAEYLRQESVPEDTHFGLFQAVVICADHSQLPKKRLLDEAQLILDTRGVWSRDHRRYAHVKTL